MGVTISGITAATTIAEADVFEIEQSGVSKKVTKTQIRSLLFSDPAFAVPAALPQSGDCVQYSGTDFITGAVPRWRTIHKNAYVEAVPASTSTITFDGSAITSGIYLRATDYFAVGTPVKVQIGAGTYYYGICAAVTSTLLTIQGATLPLSPIISLEVGTVDMVVQIPIYVGKTGYAAAVADLTAGTFRWRGRTGYLVSFAGTHETTGQPKINIKCNGNLVSTADSTNGIQLSATPGTFVETAVGTISAANYVIANAQNVVIRVTALVATQNYLSMSLVFVVP